VISLVYVTCRWRKCFKGSVLDQYEVMAASLASQGVDVEVVAVDGYNDLAGVSETLKQYGLKHKVVRPRPTPWREARMFALASALNTGLSHASGDYVFILGDAMELPDGTLGAALAWLELGLGVTALARNSAGQLVDGRTSWFHEAQIDGCAWLKHGIDPVPQGIVAFPTGLAVEINGYDEHYDGGRGLEDHDWGTRLAKAGLQFVCDERVTFVTHQHISWYPSEAMLPGDQCVARCCNTAFLIGLERDLLVANQTPYTREQAERRVVCFKCQDGRCTYWPKLPPCPYISWSQTGHPVARRIMLDEGEPTFSLAKARKENGL